MDRRTYLITGAASGVGASTARQLENDGHRVIGVDLRDTEIIADLATPDGRAQMAVEAQQLAGDGLDGVIACAGVLQETELAVRVNFFGAVSTIEATRALLANAEAPRAVVVSSATAIVPRIDELVEACLALDEEEATAIAERESSDYYPGNSRIYASTKYALSRWVKTTAVDSDWAGAGILLNAVAPCGIESPMSDPYRSEELDEMARGASAIGQPFVKPADVASALRWLASPANSLLVGQTLYTDGGFEAKARPDTL
ncbi:SDR family oxidoreductase [Candidatus Poriferisocius sp.]|uniref:SDR family oxidoreductase n=1 Tax=Candidatus Poriferisocius sp. TaxID=3101276 RepID=UPI003B015994